jgi:hypothetical protein
MLEIAQNYEELAAIIEKQPQRPGDLSQSN